MEFLNGNDLKVKRLGATDQVAQQLRTMIAEGRIPQGEKLPEIPLAEAFGVSRNTIRDGIRVLAAEGLVSHVLNRGAVVRELSPDDVADIYGLRRRFECSALDLVEKADSDLRQGTADALRACEQALERQDYGSFVEHELEFHASLVAHHRSPRLDRFFSQVIGELRLLFSDLKDDSDPETSRHILAMYNLAYETAREGNPTEGKRLLDDHLAGYQERLSQVAASRIAERERPG